MATHGSEALGIVDLILSEHKYMRDEYEHFKSVDDAAELDPRVREWIAYVSLHGHKEEIAFYPKVEAYLQDEKKGGHHLIEHGIKEHRELETELKKLAEQPEVKWKQIRKAVDKLSKDELNDLGEVSFVFSSASSRRRRSRYSQTIASETRSASAIATGSAIRRGRTTRLGETTSGTVEEGGESTPRECSSRTGRETQRTVN